MRTSSTNKKFQKSWRLVNCEQVSCLEVNLHLILLIKETHMLELIVLKYFILFTFMFYTRTQFDLEEYLNQL